MAETTFEDIVKTDNVVFHYTSSFVGINHILTSGQLRLSNLENTNDPYEYKFAFLQAMGWGRHDREKVDNNIHCAHTYIDKLRRRSYKSISFCSNKDIDADPDPDDISYLGCCKSRMWSQYGENHFGMCFAFDLDKLCSSVQDSYKKYHSDHVKYKKRLYKDEFTLDLDELEKDQIEEYCNRHVHDNISKFFYCKNPDYRDENEFRITVFDDNSDMFSYLDIKDSVIGILIGDRFEDGLLPSLLYFADMYKISTRRVYWDKGVPCFIMCAPIDHHRSENWKNLNYIN